MQAKLQRLLWWIYAGLLTALAAGRAIERILADSGGVMSRFGPLVLTTIVCVGILCWSNKKAVLQAWVWRLMFVFVVTALLSALIYALFLAQHQVFVPAGLLVLLAIVLVPAASALFSYGFRSTGIWTSAGTNPGDA